MRRGRDRVERRGRLVHQDHVGLDGDRAGDAEPLLLAAGEAEGVVLEPVLDLVPERRGAERPLDALVEVLLHARARAGRRRCCRRSTSGTGSASGRPSRSAAAPRPGRRFGAVEVAAVVDAPARRRVAPGIEVVHPVEAADERRLAAARRPDERRHRSSRRRRASRPRARACRCRRRLRSSTVEHRLAAAQLVRAPRTARPRRSGSRRSPARHCVTSGAISGCSSWCIACRVRPTRVERAPRVSRGRSPTCGERLVRNWRTRRCGAAGGQSPADRTRSGSRAPRRARRGPRRCRRPA